MKIKDFFSDFGVVTVTAPNSASLYECTEIAALLTLEIKRKSDCSINLSVQKPPDPPDTDPVLVRLLPSDNYAMTTSNANLSVTGIIITTGQKIVINTSVQNSLEYRIQGITFEDPV